LFGKFLTVFTSGLRSLHQLSRPAFLSYLLFHSLESPRTSTTEEKQPSLFYNTTFFQWGIITQLSQEALYAKRCYPQAQLEAVLERKTYSYLGLAKMQKIYFVQHLY